MFHLKIYARWLNSYHSASLGQRFWLSIYHYESISAGVRTLFKCCRPSAIFSRISKIIIDPIQRHIVRFISHIIKKPVERLPFFAHYYISSRVSAIFFASGMHIHPCLISRRSGKAMFSSRISSFSEFVRDASARSSVASSQAILPNYYLISARASYNAHIVWLRAIQFCYSYGNNCKSVKHRTYRDWLSGWHSRQEEVFV